MARSSLRRLLEQALDAGRRAGRPPRRQGAGRRPAVEGLEERTLPDATLQPITLASVAPPSVSAAAGSSNDASVSADGRYVAYESTATNLVANQASGPITSNVFLFDRTTQATTLVSHDAANPAAGGNADSFSAVLSGNGRYLYYLSVATDLVAGESGPPTENLYVYDTAAGTTRLVTGHLGSPTQAADGSSGLLNPALSTGAPFAVSADGTRVAYVSAADDLIGGMTGLGGAAHPNVFLTDTSTGTTWLVSAQAGSPAAGAGGWSPALSADGKAVAFVSDGTNLVPGQVEPTPSAATAVFLADVSTATPVTRLVSRRSGTTATVAGAASDTPVIDQDGGVVAFRSDAADLVAQQAAANLPGVQPGNVFVYERASDTVVLVSHLPQQPAVTAGGTPFTPDRAGPLPLSLSGDGQLVAYQSQAAALVAASSPPGNPPPSNVYLWAAADGGNSLVSGTGGAPADGSSAAPVLSSDGSTVAFESTAADLVPGQASSGGARNVFVAAVVGGRGQPPALVSSAAGSSQVAANADSAGGARGQATGTGLYPGSVGLSGDGTILVFQSQATNLSTDVYKADGGSDVFAYDQGTGALALVSRGAAAVVTADGDSYVASVSADDRYVAFVSDAFDLVAGQQNSHFGLNVFLRDNTAQTTTLVNHVPAPGSPTATGDSGIPRPPFTPDPTAGRLVPPPPPAAVMPQVSGDGSAVVFVSNDHNLLVGQQSPGSFNNVFRYTVADGSITLVSHLPGDLTASGAYDSNSPAVSFNGEFVALVSDGGVYLYDANAPQTLTQIAASGSSPSISDDGRYVAYVSQGNAFLYDRLASTSTLISHDAGSPTGDLLALSTPPATVTAGQAFALTATKQDPFGKTDTTFNDTVTLAVGPGSPAGAVLGGTVTARAVNGIAHFTNLMLTQAGAGYTLTASAAGVTSALTAAFAVGPAAASQLVFVPPPSLSLVNQPLNPTVTVAIEDPFGNLVPDPSLSTRVQVGLGSNPTGATLGGVTYRGASAGEVAFPGLTLDRPGMYTLTARSVGLPPVTSPGFAVTSTPAAFGITTVAGNGNFFSVGGDGGPATAAGLGQPEGVAADVAGDLYIADNLTESVRRVSPAGTITTVAGTGTAGFSGDGGPATAAKLSAPYGVAVDVAGDLYIADTFSSRVREVVAVNGVITAQSTIRTVAGNGTLGFSGDGGPATAAELEFPYGVAVDAAGNLYIADTANNRVREVVAVNGAITAQSTIRTMAGNGTQGFGGDGGPATAAELYGPSAVAVDATGNLYIADQVNQRVRRVSASGTITTVAGTGTGGFSGDGGPATSAELYAPSAVALDAAGNLYVADTYNSRVREVGAINGVVTSQSTILTVTGNGTTGFGGDGGPATAAELNAPAGAVVDAAGNLYIADRGNRRVREVYPIPTRLAILAPPPSTIPAGGQFSTAVAVQDAGGGTVAGYNGPVQVSLKSVSSVGTALTSLATVTAVNGTATFNLSLTAAGQNDTLVFTAGNMLPVSSSAIAVTPSTASALAFVQQPTNAAVGQPITPAVTVEVLDRYGNLVPGYSSAVTVALGPSSGGAALSAATQTPSQGIASFNGLVFSQTGTYVLSASSGGLRSVTSTPFSITAAKAAATIVTVAGNFTFGDGGPATAAELNSPGAVAVDAAGDVYIADTGNNRVREVSQTGTITTVAGNGGYGFGGDGGLATAAELYGPAGVAVDAAGDVYIADTGNNRVREVSPSGTITTVAGNGTPGSGGDGGPATAAELGGPEGLAVDAAGNLYIADLGNSRVREVVAVNGVITAQSPILTVAGDGTQGFSGDGGPATAAEIADPTGVAVDAVGNLYIADRNNSRVRQVSLSGIITTVAGGGNQGLGDGGPATAAELDEPVGVAVDPAGDLYIADSAIERVRRVSSGTITTVAGNGTFGFGGDGGPATGAELSGPEGLAVGAAGDVYIADTMNSRVRRVSHLGTITTAAGGGSPGLGDGGPPAAAELNSPDGVAVDAAGDLYIADRGNSRVREVVAINGAITSQSTIRTVAGNGTAGFSGDGGSATAAQLGSPAGVAVDAAGDLYIADNLTDSVRRVSPSGTITTVAGGGNQGLGDGGPATAAELYLPDGLAVDAAGNLYIADRGNSRVREVVAINGVITPQSIIRTFAGTGTAGFSGDGGPAAAAELSFAGGVAVDAAGDLYIADGNNSRVRRVAPSGTITTVAGGGTQGLGDGGPATAAEVIGPAAVAVDAAGNLYIAQNNFSDSRVREVVAVNGAITPQSPIFTVAGNGTPDFSGDGGPPTLATVRSPTAVAADAGGNLYVADSGNNRVRQVIDPARRLVVTTPPPAAVQAGTPFTVAVTVEDAGGEAVSGYAGNVSLALGPGGPAGATLSVTPAPVNLTNGVATLQVTLSPPGSGYTLLASLPGLTGTATARFNVTGSAATHLAVTSLPTPVTAGAPFTVQVSAQDGAGQTDTAFTGLVTLTLGPGSPAGASLNGPTLTVNASNGVASFSNLTIGQPGPGFTLTAAASSSGLYAATTLPFDVGAASPTLLLLSQPARVKAGAPFTFTVTAEDGAGNVATAFNGPITVNLGQDPTGAGLRGVRTVNAVHGISTFSLGVSKPGTGYTLTATAAGLPAAATAAFAVAAGPELLALSVPAAATAGTPFAVTVTAEDAAGNPDPSFAGTVTLAVGPGSPAGTFLGGGTTAAAVNGTATFPGLLLDQAGKNYTLTATTAGLTGGFSSAFTVTPGPAAQLALAPPAAAVAGSAFAVTATIQDSLGNTVSSNDLVILSLAGGPGGATLGGATTMSAGNGVATFSDLTLDTPGSGYTLKATANVAGTALAATSLPFAVGGMKATQLGVSPPAFAVAGVPFTVAVTAQDAGGNPFPSFGDLVTLALGPGSPAGSALGGTLTARAVNGVATFTGLTLATPGTGYALVAGTGSLPSVTSPPLAVLAGGDAPSSDPVVSAQGNYVAYVSAAGNLVAGQGGTGFTNVLLYQVATDSNALVSGGTAGPAAGNSDSPAIDGDGGFVAYRSDATNLVSGEDGAVGNVFLYGRSAGSTALVSAVSGSSHTGAGGSSAPAIDGAGVKVVYLSSGNGLVPGEAAHTTTNVYLYAAPLALNLLVTGQLGSATVPGNGDASNALISRDSFPLLSSSATDLVRGTSAHSNGYRNTLITTSLAVLGGAVPNGTGPNTLVASFSTFTPFAGQFVVPRYRLTGAGPDDALFQVAGARLETGPATTVSYSSHPAYVVQVLTDIGLGPIVGLDMLTLPVSPVGASQQQPPPPPPVHSFTAHLMAVRSGKRKKAAQLVAEVVFADTGQAEQVASPFQGTRYKNVQVSTRDSNGDGVPDEVVFTAKKGKRTVTAAVRV